MDHHYIESEHIVDRYLSGELSVREAREFESYCLAHPEFLKDLPIPVRLKARLSRQPAEPSETGMFQTIPSSATHAAVEAAEEGFDPAEEAEEPRHKYGSAGPSRLLLFIVFALTAAVAGLLAYGFHANTLSQRIKQMEHDLRSARMQPPSSVKTHRVRLSRSRPEQPTLSLGWLDPPQLLELRIDASEGRYNVFQVTLDRTDGIRIMQIRRLSRDSNRELRLALNSSAFGRGEFFLKFEGYDWRGRTQEVGWIRLGLE